MDSRVELHLRQLICERLADIVAANGVIGANPLTRGRRARSAGPRPADDYLRVTGVSDVFAAGDAAAVAMDDRHLSVSCQHGRPMDRIAHDIVVSELLGEPICRFGFRGMTVLDLGPGYWRVARRRAHPPAQMIGSSPGRRRRSHR